MSHQSEEFEIEPVEGLPYLSYTFMATTIRVQLFITGIIVLFHKMC